MGRMQKAIEEYQARKDKSGDDFKISDIIEIYKISNGDNYKIISNSLDAAYIIGYKNAKKEERNRCTENGTDANQGERMSETEFFKLYKRADAETKSNIEKLLKSKA